MTFHDSLHVIAGVISALLIIGFTRRYWEVWATAIIAMGSGFVVNALWEIFVDLLGWFTWFGRAAYFDVNDIYRGLLGSTGMAVLWLCWLRYKKGTWKF